jgi:5'-nucleotidase
VNNPDGHPVYIVTARSHTMLFADLDVIFDEQGVVTSAKGAPELLLGNTFKPMLNGQYTLVNEQSHPEIYRQIIADLDKSPVARRIAGAPWAETLLNTYKAKVDSTCAIPVAQVERDLAHVRLPGMSADGVAYPHGSEVAPIVCDAFLWAARQAGFQADVAIQNGGSIRVPLHAPACNLGTMYELLPYENRLVVVDLTGAQLREAILTGAHTALKGETGAFPYVAGCRMTIAAPDTAHIELKNLEIALPNGGFAPVDDHRIYHVVTNSYMASGGDDYAVFSKAPRQEVRCIDAEAMRRYAEHHGTIHPANDLRIEVDF